MREKMNMLKGMMMLTILIITGLKAHAQITFEKLTFEQAQQKAQKEGKIIFVDVMSSGMPNDKNKEAEETVFTVDSIAAFFRSNVVSIKIDMAGEEGKTFGPNLNMIMYPAYVFYDAKGAQLSFTNAYSAVKDPSELMQKAHESAKVAAVKKTNTRAIKFSKAAWATLLKQAKSSGKLIFLDAQTEWCRPCRMMERDVFNLDKIADFYNGHFINVSIDMEKGEGPVLRKKYQIKAYPTYLFINGDGKIVYQEGGYKEADIFLGIGQRALHTVQNGLSFSIKGLIDDVHEPASVILEYQHTGSYTADTAMLDKGTFAFTGTIPRPENGLLYLLKASDNKRMMLSFGYSGEVVGRDGLSFYLDGAPIQISGRTLKDAKVHGSAAQIDYEALQAQLKPVHHTLDSLGALLQKLGAEAQKSATHDSLENQLQRAYAQTGPINDSYINSHPDSYVSWDLVIGQSIISDPAKQQQRLDLFGDQFRNTPEGQQALKNVEIAFKTAIGQPAPLFAQNDTSGRSLALSSLKGKYVLVDFWASWCGPCRAENPAVKKAYAQFKNKNFEILGVSLDNQKGPWLKAIADDGLPWHQVSDLKGWKNDVGALYNVRAIPQNFLLDPNGIIIAKNLRGKALADKLTEILGQ